MGDQLDLDLMKRIKDEGEIVELHEVKAGDEILWKDGQWYRVTHVVPPFVPRSLYDFVTTDGNVQCTMEHEWTLYDGNGLPLGVWTTGSIPALMESLEGKLRVGSPDGPELLSLEPIKIPEGTLVCCLEVETPDHQFVILAT